MKKILFVNPFGIGDVLFTLSAAEAVKKKIPRGEIGFLCNERTEELVRMCSGVAYVHKFDRDRLRRVRAEDPFRYLGEYRALLKELTQKKYDVMIDLSLGREFSFLGYLARIPRRIGFDYRGRGFFLNEKKPFLGYENISVAEAQIGLLRSLGVGVNENAEPPSFKISAESQRKADLFLLEQAMPNTGFFVALAPGGGKSWGANAIYKQWEPEKFAEVINDRSLGSGMTVFLIGDESEKGLLEAVRKELTVPARMVCGQSLEVVASLIKRMKLLLGNDGGLVHLAHALKVPTVSIFGPVDEKVYGPYGRHTPHETVSEPVLCRPCYSRFHFPPCPHDRRCLSQLTPEKVLSALKKIT